MIAAYLVKHCRDPSVVGQMRLMLRNTLPGEGMTWGRGSYGAALQRETKCNAEDLTYFVA